MVPSARHCTGKEPLSAAWMLVQGAVSTCMPKWLSPSQLLAVPESARVALFYRLKKQSNMHDFALTTIYHFLEVLHHPWLASSAAWQTQSNMQETAPCAWARPTKRRSRARRPPLRRRPPCAPRCPGLRRAQPRSALQNTGWEGFADVVQGFRSHQRLLQTCFRGGSQQCFPRLHASRLLAPWCATSWCQRMTTSASMFESAFSRMHPTSPAQGHCQCRACEPAVAAAAAASLAARAFDEVHGLLSHRVFLSTLIRRPHLTLQALLMATGQSAGGAGRGHLQRRPRRRRPWRRAR